MLKQYLRIKQKYKDCILFFRLGDFYEMFFDDAKKASKILDIVLTSRNAGDGNKAPMCGVPYHSADNYIYKLIENGEKVAICEQVEDASKAKGLVKREVIRVITPGTMTDSNYLKPDTNNFILSFIINNNEIGYTFLDISTGYFKFGSYSGNDKEQKLIDKIKRIKPAEIISDQPYKNINNLIDEKIHLNISNKINSDIKNEIDFKITTTNKSSIKAIYIMLDYIYKNQKGLLKRLINISFDNETEYMLLDNTTVNNLELIETLRDKRKFGSLFYHIDKTKTSMGSRKIKNWLLNPLINKAEILNRQEVVSLLLENNDLQSDLGENLNSIIDIERLIAKLAVYTANGKDLRSLANSLIHVDNIYTILNHIDLELIRTTINSFKQAKKFSNFIDNAITDDPPTSIREGDLIKTGFNEKVDSLRSIKNSGETWISELEKSERKRTGIKNLKVGYNKVFGYYLEVTKSNIDNVPSDYTRKQTLANSERYITPGLKEKEEEILSAQEKLYDLEFEIFQNFIYELLQQVSQLQSIADSVAILDSLYSLSIIANTNSYIKPNLVNEKIIDIKDGRHPVVEKVIKNEEFIPNDIFMDNESIFHIITGPNMSGKSTFMRQVALIIIMAQIGSYVPAKEALIGITDRVFTRVGASDDIYSGQSTFMVEMNEVANICKNATERSFVILDEIGRGTSTYDGMSIARAVSEYLLRINCRALFATHYHELTDLADNYNNIKNYSVAVYDDGDNIVFLYKMIPEASNRSYGIHVCKLAGIPQGVIQKAETYLERMQNGNSKGKNENHQYNQLMINTITSNNKNKKVINQIKSLDLNNITPIDALTMINKWKKELVEMSDSHE